MVLERPNDEILTLNVGVEQGLGGDVLQHVLGAEKLVADMFDELWQVLEPALEVALHPLDHGLVYLCLAGHAQVIAGYQLDDGGKGQGIELLACPDVREVLLRVYLGLGVKVWARVEVGKGHEAQAVARPQPVLEEVAAVLAHVLQLEEVGCGEQLLHVLFVHLDLPRVYEVDHLLHSAAVHFFQHDNVLATFR